MNYPNEIYETYSIYRKLVDALTEILKVTGEITLSNNDTIDHILPVSFGFNWKIPPNIIADKRNIQIINRTENARKNYKCSEIPKFIQRYMIDTHHNMVKERIIEGIKRAKENGVYVGRLKGTNESSKTFLNKPKIKQVVEYLNLGYKSNDIIKHVDVHINTITKVKKILKSLK
jgi:hypothetical protein